MIFRHTLPRAATLLAAIGLAILTGCAPYSRYNAVPLDPSRIRDPYNSGLEQLSELKELDQRYKLSDDVYRITHDDLLEIRVFNNEPMNTITYVDRAGRISFPPLGRLEVAGMSAAELERDLENRLRDRFLKDPHIAILVKESGSRFVQILGFVNEPGKFSYRNEVYLVDMLAVAGGLMENAGNIAYVLRTYSSDPDDRHSSDSMSVSFAVYLDELLQYGVSEWNIKMRPGDIVNIPPVGEVHITGRGVETPGTYPLTSSRTTLSQIVDAGAGLRWPARSEIVLVREDPDSMYAKRNYLIDYTRLQKGGEYDVFVRDGDKIVVESSFIKEVGNGIGVLAGKVFRFYITTSFDPFNDE